MSLSAYQTITPGLEPATSLFEDRKSQFFGFAAHVESEEEAVALRKQIKEQIPEASHYVSAFRLHESGREFYSDAKEPHGTAGLPVLNVLKGHELEDVVCIVARIFGGTLLGKGGLMRAYTKAATEAVEAAQLAVRTPSNEVSILVDYPLYEPLRERLRAMGLTPQGEQFTDKVELSYFVKSDEVEGLMADVEDYCNEGPASPQAPPSFASCRLPLT